MGTTSDSSGSYLFSNLPTGHNTIEITFLGYKTLVEHLDLTASLVRNFTMVSTILVNEGITITAVGSASSMRKTPIAISRINKSELLATPSTNVIDAISRQPGVSQLSTGPAISKPVIRGLGYNRLVVINDGVRQEGQQWGDEHGIEIDENNISRIEIVKGPASLIYGSDAIAGVINIISATPAPNNTIRANVLSSYMTNNQQRSLFGSIAGTKNGFNWSTWGDTKAAADYKNKYDGRVFNSKFKEQNYGGSLGLNQRWGYSRLIVSNFNQKLGVIEGSRNAAGNFIKELPGGIVTSATNNDFLSTEPHIPYQQIQHLKFISDNSIRLGKSRLALTFGWQRNQRLEFGNADAPEEKSLHFDLHTFNYNAILHLENEHHWSTSIGVNGMAQQNRNRGVEVLIPEYNMFDVGAFVYTQKTISKSTISGGIRFDNRRLNSHELKENGGYKFSQFFRNYANASGSFGVSYSATEHLLLKANIAHGFRAPSIPELASNGAHEGTNRYEYGNPNLKSETSWQGDLGIEWSSEHVLLNASAFYNRLTNFIFYSKLPNKNGGDSLVTVGNDFIPAFQFGQHSANFAGAEMLIDIHPHPLDWFHWQNTLSYVRGTFAEAIEGSRNVPFVPATRWTSEVRAELLTKANTLRNLTISFQGEYTLPKNKFFTAFGTETPTPGYLLLNSSLSADLRRKGRTLLSIYLIGNNLSDVAYQSHLSRLKYTDINAATGRQGVFNMGRNFVFKLNVPLSFTTR